MFFSLHNVFMKDYDELISRIKSGEKDLFSIVMNDYKNMIYKIVYNQNLERGDYMLDTESLFQEGSLALYDSIFSFEQNKGMSFSSYAYMVIRSRIITYIRNTVSESNKDCYSLDAFENVDYQVSIASSCISENPIQYHRELEFENKLNSFVSNLNNEDQQIIELRSNDLSYKEIAERLKIDTKRVDNRLMTLRKKLKRYLGES